MKVIGIIAEYNPFHNGHAYQISKIRQQTNADYIVVALSGDFVQRGTPAIIDKYARTKMALSCGADLVIELPVLWATSSAESFAMAGVTLFDKIGCVDGICFGAETDNLPLLDKIAELLIEEPESYRSALASYLKEGMSFPAARANALLHSFDETDDVLRSVLNEPNNILAIEYLKAIKKRGSSLTPHLIKRKGAGYHEADIQNIDNAPTASATAIRNALATFPYNKIQFDLSDDSTHALANTMPVLAFNILNEYLTCSPTLCENDFSSILGYLLLSKSTTDLANIADCNKEIANRLIKNRFEYTTFSDFCTLNKSRDITHTRMSRILLHLLLSITDSDYTNGKSLDYIPYLRSLGFRRDSSELLSMIKKEASVPLISKLANATNVVPTNALWMLEKDIYAADLYEQTTSHKLNTACSYQTKKKTTPRSEYTREIVLM